MSKHFVIDVAAKAIAKLLHCRSSIRRIIRLDLGGLAACERAKRNAITALALALAQRTLHHSVTRPMKLRRGARELGVRLS
jgi:hypothetical protein